MRWSGGVRVGYCQFYVLDEGFDQPLLEEAFAGQVNGLCGARAGRALFLITGLHTGEVPVDVQVRAARPALDSLWEEVVEASVEFTGTTMVVTGWGGESSHVEPVPGPGSYRVRYCATGMEAGRRQDTTVERPAPDRYRLQFWPAPIGPDVILRQTSEAAAVQHGAIRDLPPPVRRHLLEPTATAMGQPPVWFTELTPDEPHRITLRWAAAWGRRIPSASRLGVDLGDPGRTLRLLPAGRRYPTVDGDMDRLMAGYIDVLTALAPPGAATPLLITHGWPQGEDLPPRRDEFLAHLTPGATYWRTDDLAREPGFRSPVHSYAQQLRTIWEVMPVVSLFASDGTDDVLIVDDDVRWTVVLRNGGLEVLAAESAVLDRVADLVREHPGWSG